MRSKRYIVVLLAVLTLFTTACASNKDTGFPAPSPTPSETEAHDEPSAEPTGPVPYSGPIDVGDSFYDPLEVEVEAGQEIEWDVTGVAPHSVTFSTLPYDEPQGCTPSATDKCTPEAGKSFSFKIDKPGRYHYFCVIHGQKNVDRNMYGYITVK